MWSCMLSHGLTDANLRLVVDAERPQAQRDAGSRSFNICSLAVTAKMPGEVCFWYPEICSLYQKTHSKCTRALHTAQRDLVRKKKNGFSTPPILRFSRRPRLLAAIAAPLDRRRPRNRSLRTLLAV